MQKNEIAREISYATSVSSRGARTLIRVVENATGRIGLIRRAAGYEHEVANGRPFWDVIVERYGLSLNVVGGSLQNIPTTGPLVLISNHPYGILDGLVMGHLLSRSRGDFRILAHSVFRRAEELNKIILPISFDETKEAVRQNLKTRADALSYLHSGGAIGIFPGGTVSTSAKPFGRPMDPVWRNFTARMILKSGATVVPVFFDGHNSRLFQLASHLHYTLRMALLIKEFRARVGGPVDLVIGKPIEPAQMARLSGDTSQLMEFLRAQTYALSPNPLKSLDYGKEFEDKYREKAQVQNYGGRGI